MWLISLFIIEISFNISKFYETSNTDLRAALFSSSLRSFFLGDTLTVIGTSPKYFFPHVPGSVGGGSSTTTHSSIFSELVLQI